MTDTQTREVTTAVAKARETRRRMLQAGASVGEVALLAAVYDLYLRLERLERGAPLVEITVAPAAPQAPLDASVGGGMRDPTWELPTSIVEVPIHTLAGRRSITGLERQQRDFCRQ